MTTDAVGGVWQFSLALARGLAEQEGCRVMLVCVGEPTAASLADELPRQGVEVETLPFRLEWMPDSADDVSRSIDEVGRLVESWQADLVHSNQFCFGLLPGSVPRVVVAHSDLLGWLRWHRDERWPRESPGGEMEMPSDLRAYRKLVAEGLAGASALVCPSNFMAGSLQEIYGRPSRVIYNGLWPQFYRSRPKQRVALVAGRLWDEAKGAATAVEAVRGLPIELRLLGPVAGPSGEATYLPPAPNARYLGSRSWADTREAMSSARFYLATSSYEPFGLAALEAALSGCTLIASDTAAYREIWGEAAVYFQPKDVGALRLRLQELLERPDWAQRLGDAARARALRLYTADRMATEYAELYRSLTR